MPSPLYNGALGTLKIDAEGGDFTSPVLTATKFTEDGNEPPTPQSITSNVHGRGPVPTGEEVPFKIQCLKVDSAEVAAVKTAARTLTKYDIEFVNAAGDTTVVLKGVQLSEVHVSALNDEGKYGFVVLRGVAKKFGAGVAYTVTQA